MNEGPLFGDYHRQIYLRGLGGEPPSIPVEWAELERRAELGLTMALSGYRTPAEIGPEAPATATGAA